MIKIIKTNNGTFKCRHKDTEISFDEYVKYLAQKRLSTIN
jgi:hypothetical protein